MARKKRNLEKVESFAAASMMVEPPFVMANERLFFQELQQRALAAIANKSGVIEDVAPEETRQPKSAARIEFEKELHRIGERIKDHLSVPPPVPPLVLTYTSSEPVQDTPGAHAEGEGVSDVPLYVLLRDLMKKAARR